MLQHAWSSRFDSSGRRLVTCGGLCVVWDTETGAELRRLEGPNETHGAILTDGSLLAARDTEVFRWSAEPVKQSAPP